LSLCSGRLVHATWIQKPYVLNPIYRKNLVHIPNPFWLAAIYEAHRAATANAVAFADGHVMRVTEAEWAKKSAPVSKTAEKRKPPANRSDEKLDARRDE